MLCLLRKDGINMIRILLVEDDADIHSFIKKILEENTYQVLNAYSGSEALNILKNEKVDLILLDLMLPDFSGEEIIKKILDIPIIVISAKYEIEDKISALLNGADDYITKPFDYNELLARIKVKLRPPKYPKNILTYKELKLDIEKHTLFINNQKVYLTKTEFLIMKTLMAFPKQVFSKNQLLDVIDENYLESDENSLKVHISHLKKKIHEKAKFSYIETIWGIGYRLEKELS